MTTHCKKSLPCALVLYFVLASCVSAEEGASSRKVAGYVYGNNGAALSQVKVMLEPVNDNETTHVARTDDKGYYEIKHEGDGPFALYFAHSKVGHCAVAHLSGIQEQLISKVLVSDTKGNMTSAAFDVIGVIEHIAFVSLTAPEDKERLVADLTKAEMMPSMSTVETLLKSVEDERARSYLNSKLAIIEETLGGLKMFQK